MFVESLAGVSVEFLSGVNPEGPSIRSRPTSHFDVLAPFDDELSPRLLDAQDKLVVKWLWLFGFDAFGSHFILRMFQ